MSTDTQTNTGQVQVEDLDNLLGMPGADSVLTPSEEGDAPAAPKSFFTKEGTDMSAFNTGMEATPTPQSKAAAAKPAVAKTPEEIAAAEAAAVEAERVKAEGTFDQVIEEFDPEAEPAANEPGRPKLDKGGMAQLIEGLIKQEKLVPFDDGKELSDYTQKDFEELIQANIDAKVRKVREETPAEFFEALPIELKHAAQYVASGGKDLKGLFKQLAAVEEIKQLDPDSERGQESIVREYLRATQFGDDSDIQEEIDSWKDLGKLEEKAYKFKPKLDSMREKIVQQSVARQEIDRKKQEEASYAYMENVHKTLDVDNLNGLAIDSKTQNMLYAGLVQPNYPSISGKPTNLFGHLIEKYQFVEPRHDLIAEALWLLADPNGYKAKISNSAKNEQVAETVRTLKTEQANKNSSTVQEDDVQDPGRKSPGLARPTKDFFKR